MEMIDPEVAICEIFFETNGWKPLYYMMEGMKSKRYYLVRENENENRDGIPEKLLDDDPPTSPHLLESPR